MKKQSRKINYKQTSLSSGVTVAPVSVAHVAPTAPTAPTALTNGQTAAAPRAQTFLRLLEMSQKKMSRKKNIRAARPINLIYRQILFENMEEM